MHPKRVQGKLGLVRSPGERLAHGRYFEVIYGATWLIVYSSWATVRLYRSEGLIDTHEIHRDFNKIEKREMSMSTRSNVKRETRTSCPVWLVSCEVRRPRWEQELKDSPYAPRTWCPDQKQASTKRQVLIFYDLYEPLPVGWIAGREALVEFPWPKSGHLPGAAVAPQGQLPADKLGHPPRMPFSICAI